MLKKTTYAVIFLLSVLLPGFFCRGYALNGKKQGFTALKYAYFKRMVIKSYTDKIPLKFKKYFNFSNFAYNIPFKITSKNATVYAVKVEINNLKYSGYHTALIKILDRKTGELIGIDDITFKTEIYAPVAVASESIGRFQIIKPADVKISYENIPSLNDGYCLKSKKIAGREAKFFIGSGSALTNANTERRRIINFGDTVNIVYNKYGLILKTKGIALQAGALNSLIRVRNAASGEILNCMVKSNKTVAVR